MTVSSRELIVSTEPGSHYRSIQQAIDVAAPGSTIRVSPGTYTGPVRMRSGVSVIGTGAESTKIESLSALATWGGAEAVVVFSGVQGAELRDLTVTYRGTSAHVRGIDLSTSSDITIADSVISGAPGFGVFIFGASRTTLAGNKIRNNGSTGLESLKDKSCCE